MFLKESRFRFGLMMLSAGLAGVIFVLSALLDRSDFSANAYEDGLTPAPAESMELSAYEYPLDRYHNAVENAVLGSSGVAENGLCVEDDRIGVYKTDTSYVSSADGEDFSESAEARARQEELLRQKRRDVMRRQAEEARRLREEREAALKAACPGYDAEFVSGLTREERAEARAFYEEGFVFYRQNWSCLDDLEYGDEGFGQCGCGPTCVSEIISNLAGIPVNPEDMRQYGLKHGSYLPKIGTTYDFMISVPKLYGIKATNVTGKEAVLEALRAGKLVLVAMGPGDFTLGAHFMLYRGITADGKILIADSYSYEHSVKAWDWNTLARQLKNGYWIYEKEE